MQATHLYMTVLNKTLATYETADLDCGDIGTSKTLKYIRTSFFSPEGTFSPTLRLDMITKSKHFTATRHNITQPYHF